VNKFLQFLKKYALITLGTACYALGSAFFIEPNGFAPGGVTGISVIITRILDGIEFFGDLPVGLFVFLINVPLLIVGRIKFGKQFLVGTIYSIFALSMLMVVFEYVADIKVVEDSLAFQNTLVAGLAGGALMGIGVGVVFRAGATTGGTDIIVKLLRLKFRHIRTGGILLVVDSVIALASFPVVDYKIETVLCSIVALFMCKVMLDRVLYGTDGARQIYIISDRIDDIAVRVTKELDIGGTFLHGIGAYSHTEKEVLMCVVKKHLFPKLKDVVTQEDPNAFLIVTSANEVFGKGYKSHFKEEQ